MNKSRQRPQAGACRVCGRTVIQPTPNQFARGQAADRDGHFWVNGHLYQERGGVIRLVDVRCDEHRHGEPAGLGYMQGRGAN